MRTARPIGEIIAGIMADLRELEDRCGGGELLSCKAAAKYLGRTPGTVSRHIAEGRLRKVTEGGVTGIRKSDLDRLK